MTLIVVGLLGLLTFGADIEAEGRLLRSLSSRPPALDAGPMFWTRDVENGAPLPVTTGRSLAAQPRCGSWSASYNLVRTSPGPRRTRSSYRQGRGLTRRIEPKGQDRADPGPRHEWGVAISSPIRNLTGGLHVQLQRRDFLAAAAGLAAATTAALVGTKPAEAGDPSFMNNVPDPLLAGKELPTFKFELEKSQGKVIGGSYGKEATVKQLPISKGMAGVSMKLEPGAMRELHWHATAAEWAFVNKGRVRTTVIDPHGGRRDERLRAGGRVVFPARPRPHARVPRRRAGHFILIFDNGYFSEFGTFSITDWIGHTPKALLAKNFGLPESTFDGFPKKEVYFARGHGAAGEAGRPARRAGSCRR